jgi:sugar phosphate isomerase/epimerase
MVPFRLGTTSYILPADLVANARFLCDKVRDMELVLFDLDDGQSNLPSPETVAALGRLADASGMTFTVHLPLDLCLGSGGEVDHPSMVKARKVIACTRALEPFAYIAHLDGRQVRAGGGQVQWQAQAARALEIVAGWAGGPARLAVENLERYPLDFILPVVERVPVSRCVDVGHLWLDGHDPLPYLRAALPRTRVVHLHGVGERGHVSLAHTAEEKLDPVVQLMLCEDYAGVLTLEVFGQEDYRSSAAALERSLGRCAAVRRPDG